MAALLLLTTRSALAQSKPIPLPLTFNEVPKGDVAAVLQGDDIFLNPVDLEGLGVTGPMWKRLLTFARLMSGSRKVIDGTEFISLKALAPYLTFKFDQTALTLSISAAPHLLAPTNLNVELGPPADITYTKDKSTFLNYSVTSQSGHHPAVFAESGTSIAGNLLLNSVSRSTTGDFVRLLSSYTVDERQRLRRWTVGDATAITDLLGGSALIGGVTVQRNFNLDPYFVRYPPLNLRGTALTPSRVEVFVNGALVSQQDVPPGPFELRNIPVASGAGNARIVVRDVVASEDRGRAGEAGSLGYRCLARYVSFGGFARSCSREYANVSMRREADRPLLDANVFITFLAARANFSLLWNETNMRDQVDTSRVTLLSNLPIGRRASLFLSLGSADEGQGRKAQVFAGLSYFFGGSTAASITVDHRDGKTQTVTEINKTLPVGTGFGYRLQSAMGDGGEHTGSGVVQYQTGFGRYEVDFDPYHSSVRPTITAAGGLVYEAGSLLPTRPVQDSFALVRVPGVPDVRVYSSNNLVGRTDSSGDVLVPNLLPYYGNRLSIDDRDVPLNYEVQSIEKTIAPPFRGGAFVPFPVKQIRTVTGSVIVRGVSGDVVPTFGQLTLSAEGKSYESPLGRGGEFYFENLSSGTYDAVIDHHDGSCRFRIDIPTGSDSIVKLGQRVCTHEAPKP